MTFTFPTSKLASKIFRISASRFSILLLLLSCVQTMMRLLYRFLLLASFSAAPCPGVANEYDYDFNVVIVDIINPGEFFNKGDVKKYAHNLNDLAHEAKEELCAEAKKLATLDGFDSKDGKIYHENHYKIQERDDRTESASISDWLLSCETIPRAYLCLGEPCSTLRGGARGKQVRDRDHSSRASSSSSNGRGPIKKLLATDDPRMEVAKSVKEVTILLRKNKFLHEPFVMNSVPVADIPKHCESDTRLKDEAKRYHLYPGHRADVCVAAKKHVVHDTLVEMKKKDLDEQQPFEVVFATNNTQRLLAIDCQSVPPMFVHFKEPIPNSSAGYVRPIDVIWVREKPVRVPDVSSRTAAAELYGASTAVSEFTPMDEYVSH